MSERNEEKLVNELFNELETCLSKTIGIGLEMTGWHLADEMDPDQVRLINTYLKTWNKTKNLIIEQSRINAARREQLQKRLDNQDHLLMEISNKLDKLEKANK